MKIVLFCAHFAPHFTGGTEQVVRAEARELTRLGHDVRVVAGTDRPHGGDPGGPADVQHEVVDGIPVSFLPRLEDEGVDLALFWPRLLDLAQREAAGADIIHVHHHANLGWGLVRHLGRAAPVMLSLHDQHVTCPRSFRSRPDGGPCPGRRQVETEGHVQCAACMAPLVPSTAERTLSLRLAVRQREFQADVAAAARVVFPSRTHLVRVSEHIELARGQARILSPGLCLQLPADGQRPQVWSGRGPLRVLHHGRRSLAKGSLDLAQAVARLPRGSVQLVCAGGAEEGVDELMREAAGRSSLELHGGYDAGRLVDLAATCHVAALPSRLPESYSLCIDEALYLGLPVWASNAEAARERHGALGLEMLPAGDPDEWAAVMQVWLDDPDLSREAMEDLPPLVPSARNAAATLERWFEELTRESRAELLSAPDERRRLA